MAESGIPARRSAAYLLDRVLGEGKLLNDLISGGVLDRLAPSDRARAQRLASDVMRNLDRVDHLVARHLEKMPALPIRNLLRIGTLELALGTAAHGVVNDLVAIASRHKRHSRLKGLVNAVLRKISADASAEWEQLPVPRLPRWLRTPLAEAWGAEAVAGFEAAHHAGAPLDLTARSDAAAVAHATGGALLPTASVRLTGPQQVSTLPGYESGDWWVQDAAAALPARLVRGRSVLDLCAAPGGKTMQLAAAGHAVTAVDVSEARTERIRANLARTDLTAEIRVADARTVAGTWDSVLVDAPCSATGTIRRHPDLPFAKDGADIGGIIGLQSELIDHALGLLPPGGQLVFCTCSLIPDEGEVQIDEALARHSGLSIDTEAMQADWIEPGWRSPEGGLRLRPNFWPEIGGLDGFYIAALRKGA